MSTCVVIPSIRQPNLDYLEPLGDTPIVVIDDSDGNISKNLAPHITVLDYADRKKLMEKDEWLIARKSPSCKALGLFWAWKEKFDTVILLDDDCDARLSPDFLQQVPIGKEVLYREAITGESGWFNGMACVGDDQVTWSRGFPYEFRNEISSFGDHKPVVSKFNAGLWSLHPDINRLDKVITEGVIRDYQLKDQAFLKPGQYFPLSIMSVQLSVELIPAFYQPLDYTLPGGHRIRRADDVWSCLFLKHVMDVKGDVLTCGGPLVLHTKESDVMGEILSEHGANLIQPYVFDAIHVASEGLFPYEKNMNYSYLAKTLGKLMQKVNQGPGVFHDIIDDYASKAIAWAKLFE